MLEINYSDSEVLADWFAKDAEVKAFKAGTIAQAERKYESHYLKMQRDMRSIQLPTQIAAMSEEQRRRLARLTDDESWDEVWEILDYGEGPVQGDVSETGAIIRSETDFECSCLGGHLRQTFRDRESQLVIRVTRDDQVDASHLMCASRAQWAEKSPSLPPWVPRLFSHHRLHSLTPSKGSPISVGSQQVLIKKVRAAMDRLGREKLAGVTFLGPGGTGKTTLITAMMIDLWTGRWGYRQSVPEPRELITFLDRWKAEVGDHPDPEFCMWRVKVPDWLVEMNAFDTREFGVDGPAPSVTAETIKAAAEKSGFQPVLWLDEIDKFRPTEARLNYLYRLTDTVYELGGTIITSANLTLSALREHLEVTGTDAIYRRLVGTNDEPEKYITFDLHDLMAREKRATKKPPKTKAA